MRNQTDHPFDQHEMKALIAPRALLTTDSLDDLWANPIGTQIGFQASREVFTFLGATEKTGLHYRHGKHDQNAEDFAASEISLPIYPRLSAADQAQVARPLKRILSDF